MCTSCVSLFSFFCAAGGGGLAEQTLPCVVFTLAWDRNSVAAQRHHQARGAEEGAAGKLAEMGCGSSGGGAGGAAGAFLGTTIARSDRSNEMPKRSRRAVVRGAPSPTKTATPNTRKPQGETAPPASGPRSFLWTLSRGPRPLSFSPVTRMPGGAKTPVFARGEQELPFAQRQRRRRHGAGRRRQGPCDETHLLGVNFTFLSE
eukprot:gene15982-biopygen9758